MLSKSLLERLDEKLAVNPIDEEIDSLFDLATSLNRFDSKTDLQSYLVEGALLNISSIGSKALSVPCGEYMVWLTDAGHTMLVPVSEHKKSDQEVFEHHADKYDVLTVDLLDNWNKVEKPLVDTIMMEAEEEQQEQQQQNTGQNAPPRSTIDADSVDRHPLMQALKSNGFTVTSLADAVGVQPPAISRLLRTPKNTQGDPGGRNPSIGLAAQVCNVLRIDPQAAFPDIFGSDPKVQARQQPGNRGSGMANAAHGSMRKGAASAKWTQGNG